VLLALFALTQVFLALAGRAVCRPPWPATAGTLERGHGLLGCGARGGFSGVSGAVPERADDGRRRWVAVIALQRHVGRAASNPTQLKQVFGWLSIGPAVSNFIGPFAAGLLIDHAGATPAH
jgi:hypothetical protein